MYYWTVGPVLFQQAEWWSCLSHSSLNISHLWFFLYIKASTTIQTSLHTSLGILNQPGCSYKFPHRPLAWKHDPTSASHTVFSLIFLSLWFYWNWLLNFTLISPSCSWSSYPTLQLIVRLYLIPVNRQWHRLVKCYASLLSNYTQVYVWGIFPSSTFQ